jgi:hypothetical protein
MPLENDSPTTQRSKAVWIVIGVALFLNFLFDYYHPGGLVFDVLTAIGLLIWYFWRIHHHEASAPRVTLGH